MHSELSFKISEEAKSRGLVLRYDVIKYREQEINFLSDPSGVQCFAQWNNQLIDLGLNNIYYKEDICRFIDRRLDLITTFPKSPEFQGAQLEWFNNQGYRDIRLKYKGRILKVFLVLDFAKVNETLLISESKKILFNCGLLEE
jgi:hypothetical protein